MPAVGLIPAATGFGADRVSRYWPTILSALRAEGIDSEAVQAGVLATLRAEMGTRLEPRSEAYPSGMDPVSYFESKYGASTSIGKKLGNTQPGDGFKYRGRGFIQLTGRSNYTNYARRIDVDIINSPDRANQTYEAARILAAYFKDRGVSTAAERGDWVAVRKLVNGGLNGWEPFKTVIANLTGDTQGGGNILPTPSTAGLGLLLAAGGLLMFLLRSRL